MLSISNISDSVHAYVDTHVRVHSNKRGNASQICFVVKPFKIAETRDYFVYNKITCVCQWMGEQS